MNKYKTYFSHEHLNGCIVKVEVHTIRIANMKPESKELKKEFQRAFRLFLKELKTIQTRPNALSYTNHIE